jgi:hypothetical protein
MLPSTSKLVPSARSYPSFGCGSLRLLVFLLVGAASLFASSRKETHDSPNALQVIVNAPVPDVIEAVQQVAGDTVIYGTQSYQRENNLTGARHADGAKAFPDAPAAGTVVYKIADSVLSPTNFKNSADMGTITVRYVVNKFDENNTNLRIDAVFIENSAHKVHASDGSVEAAEFGEVRKRVEQIQARHETDRLEEERIARERRDKQAELDLVAREEAAKASAIPAATDVEQRVAQLRKEAEIRVRASGTQLKSAPYKAAASLQNLAPYTDVVVLVVTPYWYGVQTADGHRGWVYHGEVESLP